MSTLPDRSTTTFKQGRSSITALTRRTFLQNAASWVFPVLTMFIVLQHQFIRGIMSGSVKG